MIINTKNQKSTKPSKKINIGIASTIAGLTVIGINQANADTTKNTITPSKEAIPIQQNNQPYTSQKVQQTSKNTLNYTQNKSITDPQQFTENKTDASNIPNTTNNFVDHYQPQQVNISQDYIDELPQVHDQQSADALEAKDPEHSNFFRNSYQSNPYAANEPIDVTNLTSDQLLQINLYSTRLINQIREQFNQPALTLNSEGIENAQWIANQAGKEKLAGHSAKLLQGAGENIMGFDINENKNVPGFANNSSKNFSFTQNNAIVIHEINCIKTMDDLQALVFYSVMDMFFADNTENNAYGHARNFLFNKGQMALGIEVFQNQITSNQKEIYLRWIFNSENKFAPSNNIKLNKNNSLEETKENKTISREIILKTPNGEQHETQTTTITRQILKDKNSGKTIKSIWHGKLPTYNAPNVSGLVLINPSAGKEISFNGLNPNSNIEPVTFVYQTDNNETDSYKFTLNIQYILPNGKKVATSRAIITNYRFKQKNGYSEFDGKNSKIDITGIPAALINTPERIKSDDPSFLEFSTNVQTPEDLIKKYFPGYHLFSHHLSPILYYVYNSSTIPINGTNVDTQTVSIKLLPDTQHININYQTTTGQVIAVDHLVGQTGDTTTVNLNIPDGYELASNSQPASFNYQFAANQPDITVLIKKPASAYGNIVFKFIDDQNNNTQVNNDVITSGELGQSVTTNLTIPANYELADDQTLPSFTVINNQTVYIHLKHKIRTLDPENQLNHTYRDLRTKYYYADGDKIGQQARPDSVIRYYGIRQAKQDLVTGEITGNWQLDTSKGDNGYEVLSGSFNYPTNDNQQSELIDTTDTTLPLEHYHLAYQPPVWNNVPNNSLNYTQWTEFNNDINQNTDNAYQIGKNTFHQNGSPSDAIHKAYYLQNHANLILRYRTSDNKLQKSATIDCLSGTQFDLTSQLPKGFSLAPSQSRYITVPDTDSYVTIAVIKNQVTIKYYDDDGVLLKNQNLNNLDKFTPDPPQGYQLANSQDLPIDLNSITQLSFTCVPIVTTNIQTKTITRQINVHQPDGSLKITYQNLDFTRTTTTNEAIGLTEYSNWDPVNSDTFTSFAPEIIPGYYNDIAYSETINGNTDNEAIDLYYHQYSTLQNPPLYVDTKGDTYNMLPTGYIIAPAQAVGEGSLLIIPKRQPDTPKLTYYTRTINVTMPNGKHRTIKQKALQGHKFKPVSLPVMKNHRLLLLDGSVDEQTTNNDKTVDIVYL